MRYIFWFLILVSAAAGFELDAGLTTQKIPFVAVDATDMVTREPGLVAGFTATYSINGGAWTGMTTPTTAENGGTGSYWLSVDEAGMTTLTAGHDAGNLYIEISHASIETVAINCVVRRAKLTLGQTVTASDSKIDNVKTADALTANNDKTGYELVDGAITAAKIGTGAFTSDEFADTAWDELIEELFSYDATLAYATATAGSIVKEVADNAGGSSLTVADIADGVWDELATGHTGAGKAGEQLWTDVNAILDDTGTSGVLVSDGIGAKQIDTDGGHVVYVDFVNSVAFTTEVQSLHADMDNEIATIVWNADITAYGTADTYGEIVEYISFDTDAYDTDAEHAAAIWNALTTGYGGATTYAQAIEDVLEDTGTTLDDYLDTEVAAILADTDVIGAAGAGLTALPWNATWDAQVQSEVQDALEINHLDHLFAAAYDSTAEPGSATALLNVLVENDGGVPRFTTNALETGPGSGSTANVLVSTTIAVVNSQTEFTLTAGSTVNDAYNDQAIVVYDASVSDYPSIRKISDYVGATKTVTLDEAALFTIIAGDGVKVFVTAPGTTAATAGQVADAVWDETSTGHVDAGKAGAQLWTDLDAILEDTGTTLDGKIDTVDGIVDAILVDTGTTLDDFLDTEIALILGDTERLGEPAGTTIADDIVSVIVSVQAHDTDAEIAAAVWNALVASYGSAGTYGLWVEDILVDTGTTLDDFLDTEIAAILEDTGTTLDDLLDTEIAAILQDTGTTLDDKIDALTSVGFGSGSVAVDHAYADYDLTYKTAGSMGIDNAEVWAFLKTDYDAGNITIGYIKARTITDVSGQWEAPMQLDPGTYTLYFFKQNQYGPNTQNITVTE